MDYLLANSRVVSGLMEMSGVTPTFEDVLMPYCNRDKATFDRAVASIEALCKLTDENPVFSNILKDPPQYPYDSLNGQDLEELDKLIDYLDLSGSAVEKTGEVIQHGYKIAKYVETHGHGLSDIKLWIHLKDIVGLKWAATREDWTYQSLVINSEYYDADKYWCECKGVCKECNGVDDGCEECGVAKAEQFTDDEFRFMFNECHEIFDQYKISESLYANGLSNSLANALKNGCKMKPDIAKIKRSSLQCFEVVCEYGAVICDQTKKSISKSTDYVDTCIKSDSKWGPLVALDPEVSSKTKRAQFREKRKSRDLPGLDAYRATIASIKAELIALGGSPTRTEIHEEYMRRKAAGLL